MLACQLMNIQNEQTVNEHEHTHEDIGCLEAIEALYAYLDGELGDDVSIEQVEKHMEHCRSCYSRKDVERALTEHIRRSQQKKAPDALQSRLRKLMDEL
jgi:anti-sigma factor (TIGR02949 family)